MDYLTLKRPNYSQNKKDMKVTHSFSPTPLIFKFQQKV